MISTEARKFRNANSFCRRIGLIAQLSLLTTVLAPSGENAQFNKWEDTGLLGVLPPAALDQSPLAGQVRADLAGLDVAGAREASNLLIRQQPGNYEGYFWAGFVDLQQGRLYEGVRHLRQAERLRPRGNSVAKVIGLVYLELGQYHLFELKMHEAMAVDPADFSPHYCWARYLQSHKRDHEQAAKHYYMVLARRPDHYEALYYLGLACEARGDMQQAADFYERAASASEMAPHNFGLPYEGLSRINRTGHPNTALKFASRAVSLEPKSADSQLELARAYMALGKFSEAVNALKTSIALDPTESAPYYHLFLAYRHLGQPKAVAEALTAFQRATGCYGKHE
jgi:tetratricopeptide (TPR) repeat protein